MKLFTTAISLLVLTWVSCIAGVAVADTGAGVCVAGNGFSLTFEGDGGPFTGVNAGTSSESGVYTSQADYEAQCCAEAGLPADCFAPV